MGTDIRVSEIRDSFPGDKNDAIWTRFVLRPLSFFFAWAFIRLRFSANQVTYLSIFFVFIGGFLFIIGSHRLAIVAAVCFNVFALLDCVDGNIARVRGGNPFGEWVDALGGYTAYSFLFLSVGMYVEVTTNEFWFFESSNFLLMGAIAAVTNLLMRIQSQKLENIGVKENDGDDKGIDSIQHKVDRNVGITGFLMPVVLVSVIIGMLEWVLLFYAVFYSAAWLGLTFKNIYDIENVD